MCCALFWLLDAFEHDVATMCGYWETLDCEVVALWSWVKDHAKSMGHHAMSYKSTMPLQAISPHMCVTSSCELLLHVSHATYLLRYLINTPFWMRAVWSIAKLYVNLHAHVDAGVSYFENQPPRIPLSKAHHQCAIQIPVTVNFVCFSVCVSLCGFRNAFGVSGYLGVGKVCST